MYLLLVLHIYMKNPQEWVITDGKKVDQKPSGANNKPQNWVQKNKNRTSDKNPKHKKIETKRSDQPSRYMGCLVL